METVEKTIRQLADILDAQITLTRYPNQDGRWTARFADCETKDTSSSPILSGTYGDGETPLGAITDYVNQILGKVLVFRATSNNRRDFVCPKNLIP